MCIIIKGQTIVTDVMSGIFRFLLGTVSCIDAFSKSITCSCSKFIVSPPYAHNYLSIILTYFSHFFNLLIFNYFFINFQ